MQDTPNVLEGVRDICIEKRLMIKELFNLKQHYTLLCEAEGGDIRNPSETMGSTTGPLVTTSPTFTTGMVTTGTNDYESRTDPTIPLWSRLVIHSEDSQNWCAGVGCERDNRKYDVTTKPDAILRTDSLNRVVLQTEEMSTDKEEFDCFAGPGYTYKGMVSTTESGAQCDPWPIYDVTITVLLPEILTYQLQHDDFNHGLPIIHSFCRNPNNKRSRPWCFVEGEPLFFLRF